MHFFGGYPVPPPPYMQPTMIQFAPVMIGPGGKQIWPPGPPGHIPMQPMHGNMPHMAQPGMGQMNMMHIGGGVPMPQRHNNQRNGGRHKQRNGPHQGGMNMGYPQHMGMGYLPQQGGQGYQNRPRYGQGGPVGGGVPYDYGQGGPQVNYGQQPFRGW